HDHRRDDSGRTGDGSGRGLRRQPRDGLRRAAWAPCGTRTDGRQAKWARLADDLARVGTVDRSVFEASGGIDGLRRLAAAWHARVMADEVVSHAFSHGFHPQHTERLAAYWAEALGGATAYSDAIGDETSVVRMHSGNGV